MAERKARINYSWDYINQNIRPENAPAILYMSHENSVEITHKTDKFVPTLNKLKFIKTSDPTLRQNLLKNRPYYIRAIYTEFFLF